MTIFFMFVLWLFSIAVATGLGAQRQQWHIGLFMGLLFGPLGMIVAGLLDYPHRCPRCCEAIHSEAEVCPYCHIAFASKAPVAGPTIAETAGRAVRHFTGLR